MQLHCLGATLGAKIGVEYGIGTPAKAQPDTGNRQLIMEMVAPPGVDTFDLREFQAWNSHPAAKS